MSTFDPFDMVGHLSRHPKEVRDDVTGFAVDAAMELGRSIEIEKL